MRTSSPFSAQLNDNRDEISHRQIEGSEITPEAKVLYVDVLLRDGDRDDEFERSCARWPTLRHELKAIHRRLHARKHSSERPGTTLEGAHSLLDRTGSHPRRIGNYTILGVFGEGGMGTVYRAQQTTPIRRRVALKLVRRKIDTREAVSRFESERQVLASLDHPNIPRVYDAGTTPGGRPYFVMEAVCGPPITTFCDRHRLTIVERLKLFVDACDALSHAHRRGVIHRDVKPTNILVVKRRNGPTPKIIDFGVSKTARRLPRNIAPITKFGQLLGTPAYMSPEQAEVCTHRTDARTDVYSLGIVLYELLTGVLPHDPNALRGIAYEDLPRLICKRQTFSPSTRLTDPTQREEVAARRQTSGRALMRQISGDLDRITLKALAKDRDERYACVDDLAADVRHFLADEPVAARPSTVWYRFTKSLRKNRVALACGIACALLLAVNALLLWALLIR